MATNERIICSIGQLSLVDFDAVADICQLPLDNNLYGLREQGALLRIFGQFPSHRSIFSISTLE
jgi:hypothetical protein